MRAPKPVAHSRRFPRVLDPQARGFAYTELPEEVRSRIAGHVVGDITSAIILPHGDGYAVWPHALAHASQMTHRDCSALLSTTSQVGAATIFAKVDDFHFAPLLRYLADVVRNPRVDVRRDFAPHGPRKLFVDCSISAAFGRNPTLAGLERWFRWLAREGAGLHFEYRFESVADRAAASEMMSALDPGPQAIGTRVADLLVAFRAWEVRQPTSRPPTLAQRVGDHFVGAAGAKVRSYYDAIYDDMARADAVARDARERAEAMVKRDEEARVAAEGEARGAEEGERAMETATFAEDGFFARDGNGNWVWPGGAGMPSDVRPAATIR